MSVLMERPGHLPDFDSPPLHEVYMGLQFAAPQAYQQIRAGEVWALFKKDYPQVQEYQALEPSFETFGVPSQRFPQIRFGEGGVHDRFWFLNKEGTELIQFQQDRLLHNWRHVEGANNNQYPRFEVMMARFEREISLLQSYMNDLSSQTLCINQCEICYVNHLEVEGDGAGRVFGLFDIFNNQKQVSFSDFNFSYRETMYRCNEPCGRLYVSATAGYKSDGKEVIVFQLTVKGSSIEPTISSGLDFIRSGRELIVTRFAELTSEAAHTRWRRVQ